MADITQKKLPMTKTTAMHYFKLLYKSLLLVCSLIIYLGFLITKRGNVLYDPKRYNFLNSGLHFHPAILIGIWVIFVVEMILRFFPSKIESPGSQKHFKRNFVPYKKPQQPVEKMRGAAGVFWGTAAWVALNVLIITLFFVFHLDNEVMFLVFLTYSVCDMICILFFCPFQTWFMKNRCCTACRIYNWDFAMMFTPFFAVWSFYTTSLLAIALVLLLEWEIIALRYPERFDESKNLRLSCGMCNEKLCHNKRQLQLFLAKNSEHLLLKGNLIINREIEKLRKRKELHEQHIKSHHEMIEELERSNEAITETASNDAEIKTEAENEEIIEKTVS